MKALFKRFPVQMTLLNFMGVILIGTIVYGLCHLWWQAYTPEGQAYRQTELENMCAAGESTPQFCIDSGVDIAWSVKRK